MHPSKKRILVIEDEPAIAELIAIHLKHAGFDCELVSDAASARAAVFEHMPDLVLLDWMLPGMSGETLLKLWRTQEENKHLPIIMLTARADEADKLSGLGAGADDYITKPFSTKELIARIHAVLGRASRAKNKATAVKAMSDMGSEDLLTVGLLRLDVQASRVTVAGVTVDLSPTERRVLTVLLRNPEKAMSRDALLHIVWSDAAKGMDIRTVDAQVKRIREALMVVNELAAKQLQTVRGEGYRLSGNID